ncbi:hypothetical protein N7466_002534 [Penicillium verhagenii]|uniref:uncharacterized protein n=1 Tax=Penicillium verhagenii TaxID=1562060 RepID=UPI002544D863|nr:uncharacterized protein N7466_002534 [Penicillium verhagenii]KAJ5939400.1 hypothetical protein N7466_002534 [Penicillium verhagenii]
MAFSLGRPRAINTSDCTITTPLDRDIPVDPAKTVPTALFPHEPPSSFTPHLFQYAICQQIHEAMSLGIHKRYLEDYSLVKTLHDRVLYLLSNLPPVHRLVNPDTFWDLSHPHIPKQRQQISTAANSFLMALHRPHAKTHVASLSAAIEAAISTLDAQERLFDLMSTRYYSIYALSVYTVDAAIFLSVTILEHPPSDPGILHRIHHAVEKATRRLESAQERISLARAGLQILKHCHLKMQSLSHPQIYALQNTAHQPNPLANSINTAQTQIENPSDLFSWDFANLPESGTMPIIDTSQLDSTVMFEDITVSNFDIESWVKHMSQMNNLE